jgi:hypothetical protein
LGYFILEVHIFLIIKPNYFESFVLPEIKGITRNIEGVGIPSPYEWYD